MNEVTPDTLRIQLIDLQKKVDDLTVIYRNGFTSILERLERLGTSFEW